MAAQFHASPLAKNNYIPKYLYMTYVEEAPMGIVLANIELLSGEDVIQFRRGVLPEDRIRRVAVRAIVDSGAVTLCINELIQQQLGLLKVDVQTVELADGSRQVLDVVGPVEVRFENRRASVDALVLPGSAEVLLGAIPIESMDVLIDAKNQRLVVNPESPYMAQAKVKSPRPPRL
jgi:clan AA aspartic protease